MSVIPVNNWPPGMVTGQMIREARDRIKDQTIRTPLVRLNLEDTAAEIYLKLECLQPTGSFKVRGVSNALSLAGFDKMNRGVYTVSAGNMAQALARGARMIGVPCSVVVPENTPNTKIEGVKRYGARVIPVSFEKVWEIVETHQYGPLEEAGSMFIHPFADARMIAGNGTIGFELFEDLPNVESVIVPFGGGGLATGIATALKSVKPSVRVFACEPETAAPLAASYEKGSAQTVNRRTSFVDGIGGKSVLEEMWTVVRNLLEGSISVSLQQVADAGRLLVERNRIIAEGAGAASLAAALSGKAGRGITVCIISGGNIDLAQLIAILEGRVP